MTTSSRGRLTLPDLGFILMDIALMGVLFKVFGSVLSEHANYLDTGEALLAQTIIPLFVVVLFTVIFLSATAGGSP